jgi:8-oxo-dGTP pyrophosphatase MutT (NUDIX family)
VREVFEETGVLLAKTPGADPIADLGPWRERLLNDQASLADLLIASDATLDTQDMVYFAHWVTPIAEPRRFDTRFFLARLPEHAVVDADPREMVDAVWLTPDAAIQRFHEGKLPMVFPTVRTLESLCGHASVDALLDAFRGREVELVLPRLVRTETGVGIVIDEEDAQ